MRDRCRPVPLLLLIALLGSCSARTRAADHLLTIGGGSHASSTQVSLEKNVLFLQSYLRGANLDGLPNEILFGDGKAGGRDVQFDDPGLSLPRVNEVLAKVLDGEHLLSPSYRPHAIPHVWGAADRQGLANWFDTVGSKLRDDDRLIIYYTGHGGRGQRKLNQGTTIALWNEKDMPVKEFGGLLDQLPPKVQVVLVMVQCFSGGFANLIYADCDPNKGLSPRNRCGFFATLPDRTAAGCTSDINEEDYKEYSTYFWAALAGHTRAGKAIASADYDGDGKISFAEAHAYTLVSSETVDISIKSSDVFLRKFSRTTQNTGMPTTRPLITAQDEFAQLLAAASPADAAALKGLAKALKLDGSRPVIAAIRLADDLQKQRKLVGEKKSKLESAHKALRISLDGRLKGRWPELANLLHPVSGKIISEQGDEIVKFLEAAPRFKEFEKQDEDLNAAETESMDLERTWVKAQRFIRTAESVALAANLPNVASPELVTRYRQMVAAEGMTFNAGKQ